MKRSIEKAFRDFDKGVRPDGYKQPQHWYVRSQQGKSYPAKAIWAMATNDRPGNCHTNDARIGFSEHGYSLIDNRTIDVPPAVRILPMTNDLQTEFPEYSSIEDMQQKYFLVELPSRENGNYYYHKKGLQAVVGTVVLFQCQASIIASATLTGKQQFRKPDKDGYNGCLFFDVTTIRTFKPITADIISDIWPNFKGFNRAKWDLDPTRYPELEKRLKLVLQPEMLPTQEATDLVAPSAGRILVKEYRILRDTELARRVKIIHNFKCQICGHAIEIPNSGFYAESHHIQPLGQPHNGPDIMGNIICVCPNHHAELDYGVSSLSLPSLRQSTSHKIGPKYIDYHNQIILKSVNR